MGKLEKLGSLLSSYQTLLPKNNTFSPTLVMHIFLGPLYVLLYKQENSRLKFQLLKEVKF